MTKKKPPDPKQWAAKARMRPSRKSRVERLPEDARKWLREAFSYMAAGESAGTFVALSETLNEYWGDDLGVALSSTIVRDYLCRHEPEIWSRWMQRGRR